MKKLYYKLSRQVADRISAFQLLGPGVRVLKKTLPQPALHGASLAWENVLILAPHPDDEALGACLLLQRLREEGKRITIAFLTDGDAYNTGEARERKHEAEVSAGKLGAEAVFLRLRDGGLTHTAGLGEKIAALTGKVQPDAILLPWLGEYHPDHRAVTRAAIRQPYSGAYYLFYSTFSPLWPCSFFQFSFLMGGEGKIREALADYTASLNPESADCFLVLRRVLAKVYLNNPVYWEPYLGLAANDLPKAEKLMANWPQVYPTIKKTRHWRQFIKEVKLLEKSMDM